MNRNQFKNQLKAYIKKGDFEYIFDKQKLILDNVADPDNFVKGKFREVFVTDAESIFSSNPNFFRNIEIAPDIFIDTWEQLKFVSNDLDMFNLHIGNKYIKIE